MQYRSLRVINEDVVAPGGGFPTHPHRDMEILTWILDGALEHRDNTGGSGVIRPGELQHMTAGRCVLHSEFNPSQKDPVHLLQIWLLPERRGLDPDYEQLSFSDAELRNKFGHVAGPEAPVTIRQNADLYIARLDQGANAEHSLEPDRGAWVQVARGKVKLNGTELKAGDGAAVSNETERQSGSGGTVGGSALRPGVKFTEVRSRAPALGRICDSFQLVWGSKTIRVFMHTSTI